MAFAVCARCWQKGCCGLIQNQGEYTACGPDELRGQAFDVFWAEEDFVERGGLCSSFDEEKDFAGVVDDAAAIVQSTTSPMR